jgi:hypothetical protein
MDILTPLFNVAMRFADNNKEPGSNVNGSTVRVAVSRNAGALVP